MPTEDTDTRPTAQPLAATLDNLDRLWTIAVGPQHRRLLGGTEGRRFATDGGAMVMISDAEFDAHMYPWSRPEGLARDHWGEKSSVTITATRQLSTPDELMTLDHRLGARYGETWISTLYVDLFLRLGGSVLRLTSDPMAHTVVPSLGVIMPLDPSKMEPS